MAGLKVNVNRVKCEFAFLNKAKAMEDAEKRILMESAKTVENL